MSRPFSYHDENFTVIGNVLFVHFKYERAAEVGTRLIEIPPEIYNRLLFYSNMCSVVYHTLGYGSNNIALAVVGDNKHYFYTKNAFGADSNRYIFGIFMLT